MTQVALERPATLERGARPPVSEPVSTTYVYRRADHGSAADRALLLSILSEYVTEEGSGDDAEGRYGWLYRDNPHGEALTFLALDLVGNPVGVTSLFPRRVMVAGEQLTGAIGGDGYVTPVHRRRGVVTALHREALAAMCDGSVGFMFGPPEPNNLRALVRAGARVTGHVQRYARPLAARGLGSAAGWLGPTSAAADWALRPRRTRLAVVPLGAAPDLRVDRVFRDVADARSGDVIPVTDAAFYAWRFGGSPAGRQRGFLLLDGDRPVAVAAVERHADAAAIVDITAPWQHRPAAYAAIADLCKDVAILHVQVHVPSPRERALLHTKGFWPRRKKAFQVQVPENHRLVDTLTRATGWQYMWGDGDVDHVL